MRPIVIDLYGGLGGWAEAFLAEGYYVVGFDIERHDYGTGGYPGQLVIQDVRTLHGRQFRDAAVIVASPPCTEYSYMAMPWSRAKQIAGALRGECEFPEGYKGSRTIEQLNELFNVCFRIQREASEASGRHIPMIVENVKGAQPWVGRAKWNFGSFYLWGDVPALMPITLRPPRKNGEGTHWRENGCNEENRMVPSRWEDREIQRLADATKNNGGSWFNIAHNTESGHGQNPVNGVKVEGQNWNRYKKTGEVSPHWRMQKENVMADGSKCGSGWFGTGNNMSLMRQHNSKSSKRKAASAQIAKIPFPLAQHIAKCFRSVSLDR